jgi:hypothetical protein
LLFTFLSSGSLLTKELTPVGPSWWKPAVLFLGVQGVLIVVGLLIPLLIRKIWRRKAEKFDVRQ